MLKPTVMALLLSVLFSLQIQANPVACRYFYERIDDLDNITMDTRNATRDPVLEVLKNVMAGHVTAPEITPNMTVDAFLEFLKIVDPYKIFISEQDLIQMRYPEREFFSFLHSQLNRGTVAAEYGLIYNLSRQRLEENIQKFIRDRNFRKLIVARADKILKTSQDSTLFHRPKKISDIEPNVVNLLSTYLVILAKNNREKPTHTHPADLADLIRVLHEQITDYKTNVSPETIRQLVTKSYLKQFDQHTDMFLRSEQDDFLDMDSNTHTNLGFASHIVPGGFRIETVSSGSAAERSGLKPGDVILAVEPNAGSNEWRTARTLPHKNLRYLLRDETESNLRLRILRENKNIVVTITRKAATAGERSVHSIITETDAGPILNLKLESFSDGSALSLRDEINLRRKEKNFKGIVLDLRGNGGGSIKELGDILKIFVDRSPSIIVKFNDGRSEEKSLPPERPLWHGPLVVLVDHASASSSEGLAAALSSHRRAIIIGSETYGKGTMQNYTESSEGALYKYTSAYFYSPTGRPIQWNGAPIDIPLLRTNEGFNYSERSGFNSLTPVRLSGQLPKINPAFSDLDIVTQILKEQSDERVKRLTLPKTADEIEELNTREAYHILADWINLE